MSYIQGQSVCIPPEEFTRDAESKLGRANGNTYQRKPGVENVHDGQIMVRLKKKRFIVLDYGYTPTSNDLDIAKRSPHISIPSGAGRTKCATKDCPRIGVPTLLYDTEPTEPMSLYMRGGLCFSCQKNMNEKRRTQRKRKSDGHPVNEVRIGGGDSMPSIGSVSGNNNRFRFNDQIVELNPDAVVINGPVEGTRTAGPGYGCPEIGSDLLRIVSELSQETYSLLQHASGAQAGMPPTASSVDHSYQRAFLSASRATFLLTQWKASYDAHQQAAQAAVASANFDSRVLNEAVARGGTALGTHAQGFYPPGMGQGMAFGGGAVQPLLMPPDEKNDKNGTSRAEV